MATFLFTLAPMSATAPREALIESLDHDGRGVARVDGKTVFIEGALPGERVEFVSYRVKPKFELADVTRIVAPSAQRVAPPCVLFGECGGCSMQHLEPSAQLAAKQRVLENALWHLARVRADVLYPVISGAPWGYRFRARLSVRLVPSKGGVRIGFHQRRSSYIVDMRTCPVLPPHVSAMLPAMRELVAALSVADRLATRGDNAGPAIAAHLELASELTGEALAWRAAGPPVPLVRGDELADALGIAPGPELGPLLAAIAEARFAGEIDDRDGAVALARSLRGG